MHDNPQHAPDPAFRLSGHGVVALEGLDAVAFAQAQFATDVVALEPGHWHWSCWLTPKGRVIAVFALLRLAPDLLWLVLPDSDPESVAAALRRFVFRSKVKVEPLSVVADGCFAAPAEASGSRLSRDGAGTVELDLGTPAIARTLRLSTVASEPDAASDARWQGCDLEHGLPRLPASQVEQWTPQQLSLERLGAYSVRKGYYPGQEIVARTHFLGKAKRGLVLLATPSAQVDAGVQVDQQGQPIGTVVSATCSVALAVLPLDRAQGALSVAGAEVTERPLTEGLQR